MTGTDRPDILIFPPLAVGIALVVAVALEWILPIHILPPVLTGWSLVLGMVLVAIATILVVGGARTFTRSGTNVDPRKPALKIIESGPYQYTRNPMYLGMVVLQFGLAFLFSLDWAILGGVVLWAVLHYGVVLREEAYLAGKFGGTYTDFTARTRRWL